MDSDTEPFPWVLEVHRTIFGYGDILSSIVCFYLESDDSPIMTMLIAYDGRPNTEKALEYAVNHSVTYGEKLIILVVVSKGSEADLQKMHGFAERAVVVAKEGGAEVQSIVESGQPDKVILETASRFSCDTIIVGRSGKTALDRVIMGSVSNSIVANAKCTVIVVQ